MSSFFTSALWPGSHRGKGVVNMLGRTLRGALVAVAVLALAGCQQQKDDTDDVGGSEAVTSEEQALVEQTLALEASSQQANALTAIPGLALGSVHRSADQAAEAQDGAPAFFQPEGCLTVTRDLNVVTYEFDACSGPYGLRELTGRETATFSVAEDGVIGVSLASEGLSMTDVLTGRVAAIEHAAEVSIVHGDGGAKTATWNGAFTSTGENGAVLGHTSSLVFGVDASGCHSVDGTTSTTAAERGITTTFDGLVRCASEETCPAGTIAAATTSGATFSLEFDGSDVAVYTGPQGREVEVPLLCTPMEGG